MSRKILQLIACATVLFALPQTGSANKEEVCIDLCNSNLSCDDLGKKYVPRICEKLRGPGNPTPSDFRVVAGQCSSYRAEYKKWLTGNPGGGNPKSTGREIEDCNYSCVNSIFPFSKNLTEYFCAPSGVF